MEERMMKKSELEVTLMRSELAIREVDRVRLRRYLTFSFRVLMMSTRDSVCVDCVWTQRWTVLLTSGWNSRLSTTKAAMTVWQLLTPITSTRFRDKFMQLYTDFGGLGGEVSALWSAATGIQTLSEEVSAQKRQIGQKLNNLVVEQLSTRISHFQHQSRHLHSNCPSHRFRWLIRKSFQTFQRSSQSSGRSRFHFCGEAVEMVSKLQSSIADVTVTQTLWLWFWTQMETSSAVSFWWNGNWKVEWKADDSQKSFLFILKNLHNILTKRFALKAEMKAPHFPDIGITDNCNINTNSFTSFWLFLREW
jgi:hypothetical protein